MKLLIDTSNKYLYLELLDNNSKLIYFSEGNNDHSEKLIDAVSSFMQSSGYTVNDITEVIVGRGPGSYTGVRVSGVVAKVLASIKNLKLTSFSSLDLLLTTSNFEDGKYLIKMDAKRGHSYAKVVIINNGKLEVIKDEAFLENTELEMYNDYITITQDTHEYNTDKLFEFNLLRAENVNTYVPNYIRKGI